MPQLELLVWAQLQLGNKIELVDGIAETDGLIRVVVMQQCHFGDWHRFIRSLGSSAELFLYQTSTPLLAQQECS